MFFIRDFLNIRQDKSDIKRYQTKLVLNAAIRTSLRLQPAKTLQHARLRSHKTKNGGELYALRRSSNQRDE